LKVKDEKKSKNKIYYKHIAVKPLVLDLFMSLNEHKLPLTAFMDFISRYLLANEATFKPYIKKKFDEWVIEHGEQHQ
jgi:hypothetical protein